MAVRLGHLVPKGDLPPAGQRRTRSIQGPTPAKHLHYVRASDC